VLDLHVRVRLEPLLGALALACVVACSPARTPVTAPDTSAEIHVPLSVDGAPVGDVTGHWTLFSSADGSFVRFTARGKGAHISIDRVDLEHTSSPVAGYNRGPFVLGDNLTPQSFDLCFDPSILPVALRSMTPGAATASGTFVVLNKTFTFDHAELCLKDGDLRRSFALLVFRWKAPGGVTVFVETAAEDDRLNHYFGDPPRSEKEILDNLLFL
jgi:hypothetical protein